ncbi:hypothetical protein [Priestia aryabhattai]|uniref:hypothetical protein n=1 Tax=Priestia aryabhattai TaxID=412384 RepID=UPI0015F67A0D|nr:hypothetical protein [Priestia aryabhattai]
MSNSARGIGAGYGRLKSENSALKKTIENLKFENAMLKNHNKQLFKQVYNNEIDLKGRGTVTVGRNS